MSRAEAGIGTLIIFITALFVAAIAAGVLIQTSGVMRDSALTTGSETKRQISTGVRLIESVAHDGTDHALDSMITTYKLAPGSEGIRFSDILYSESTSNTSSSMGYRIGGEPKNDVFTGFFTASDHVSPASYDAFTTDIDSSFKSTFPSPFTSSMMIGKIAVALVFVESNGTVDANTENWTQPEISRMVNATGDALNWWKKVEPRAGIKHTFEIYEDVSTSYEPILYDSDTDGDWIGEALDGIGAEPGATDVLRARAFVDDLRDRMNAHWAYIIFMVDSSHTPGGFAGGTTAGYAYVNGPYSVVGSHTFGVNPVASLIAHETGHIFGARDEYTGCACTDVGGYYSIQAQNCNAPGGCITNVSSIMRAGSDTVSAYDDEQASLFVLGQIGMFDGNSNNLLDPVDLLFEADADGAEMTTDAVAEKALGSYRNPSLTSPVGYYSIQYIENSSTHVHGNFMPGDVVSIYHESARPIIENDHVKLGLVSKNFREVWAEMYAPEVIHDKYVTLFP